MERRLIAWPEVFQRLDSLGLHPDKKIWGIPRGGQIVAGLIKARYGNELVDHPSLADLIVDDIVDSGKTKNRFASNGVKFFALVDKQQESISSWVTLPWELRDETADLEDTVIRKLEFIGEDPNRDGLKETPRRVIKAFSEMTVGYKQNPSEILSKVFDVPYDEIVILKDIEFWSLCEHHLLPFHGKIHIGYLPSGKVVGISKLARLAFAFSRRLQVQERLTQDIANSIMQELKPQGVGVVIEATHLCMAMRGVQTPATMVTSCLLGLFRDRCRQEFLDLVRVPASK